MVSKGSCQWNGSRLEITLTRDQLALFMWKPVGIALGQQSTADISMFVRPAPVGSQPSFTTKETAGMVWPGPRSVCAPRHYAKAKAIAIPPM